MRNSDASNFQYSFTSRIANSNDSATISGFLTTNYGNSLHLFSLKQAVRQLELLQINEHQKNESDVTDIQLLPKASVFHLHQVEKVLSCPPDLLFVFDSNQKRVYAYLIV